MGKILSPPLILGRFHPTRWSQPILTALNRFTYSPVYIYIIAVLSAVANIFSFELEIYTLFVAMYICICLFCRDLMPVMPMLFSCYIIPSGSNNPGINSESMFAFGNGGWYILLLAAIVVFFLLVRLSFDAKLGFASLRFDKFRLLPGVLLLGIAYIISGIGSERYSEFAQKNIFFGFLQFAALIVPYFVFCLATDREQIPTNYLFHIGLGTGLVLLAEIINIYFTQDVIVDGLIKREFIHTGWGMYNNLGGMMAMMLPFPFYFACKQRTSLPGIFFSSLIMAGIILTNSRSSILFGAGIYGLCLILTLILCKDKIGASIAISVIIAGICYIAFQYWEQLASLFNELVVLGWQSNGRDEIYANGIQQFLRYPIFGGTFYPLDFVPNDYSELEAFSSFFPPRWHNTFIQLLACCGIVGLGAYLFHCVQAVWLLVRKPSLAKTFIGLSALTLMATSMLDCHFFNIGPVLFYSMALAFAESSDKAVIQGKYEKKT